MIAFRPFVPLALLAAMAALAGAQTPPSAAPLPAGQVEIDVRALHCKSCAKKVSRKLYAVAGVTKVTSSVKNNRVFITTSTKKPVDSIDLLKAVADASQEPIALRRTSEQLDEAAVTALLEPAGAASALAPAS
ncbi:MAG: heavy metal-associated domain-containing protein [Planctomycetota bacterium]